MTRKELEQVERLLQNELLAKISELESRIASRRAQMALPGTTMGGIWDPTAEADGELRRRLALAKARSEARRAEAERLRRR